MVNAMKNPLNYQSTEYDCGPTSLLNALSVLFHRDEIPPELVKSIPLYCLDAYSDGGEPCKNGTSKMAMRFVSGWLSRFGEVRDFPLRCVYLRGREVALDGRSRILSALNRGGVAVCRVMYGCWHYVLLTEASGGSVSLFDPYYREEPFEDEAVQMVSNLPKTANRRVSAARMDSVGAEPYALGPLPGREAVLLYKIPG